ncbi:MAG: hypothetical protein ACLFPX_04270 [Candidatus Omnitrophota bacterium]
MQRFVLPLLLMICMILGSVYLVLGTPLVLNFVLPDIIETVIPAVDVISVRAQRQSFKIPEFLTIHGLELKGQIRERAFQARFESVTLLDFIKAFQKKDIIELRIEGADISNEIVGISGGRAQVYAKLRDGRAVAGKALLQAQNFRIGAWDARDVSFRVQAYGNKLKILELTGGVFEGAAEGQITLDFKERVEYVIWLEYRDVRLSRLADAFYRDIFAATEGKADGSLRIVGSGKAIEVYNVEFFSRGPVQIKKPMVERLLSRVDSVQRREELEQFRNDRGGWDLTKMNMRIHNGRRGQAVIMYHLKDSGSRFLFQDRFSIQFHESLREFLHSWRSAGDK